MRLPLKARLKLIENASTKRVAIIGYTGQSVDLNDMGIPDPLVYDLNGLSIDNNVPYYDEHTKLIGHTVENSKVDGELHTIAEHSVDNDRSLSVYESIKNGDNYEASMGVSVETSSVEFIPTGTVNVNGRTFNAPIYVARNSRLDEMTATRSGRDPNTSIHLLSTPKDKEELMTIKNSATSPPTEDIVDDTPITEEVVVTAEVEEVTEAVEEVVEETPPQEELAVANSTPKDDSWMWDYIDDPVGRTLIKNARSDSWDRQKMDREIEIAKIQNSYPGVPGTHTPDTRVDNSYDARMALSVGVSLEVIERHCGKRAADYADSVGPMGLKESIMLCANANGGRFNGHSDTKAMAKHVKTLVVRNSFSTIDYPNLMHRIAQWKMEDIWELDPPETPSLCKEVNNRDFRKTGHIKAKGGKMWDSLDKDGKISHGTHGKEDTYETELNTIAQILTFKREDIINDDIGWLDDTLTLMLEGATMIPDYMFTRLWYGALNAGVVTPGQSHYTLPLDQANLSTVYNNVRRRYTDKKAPVKDKQVNGRFNTRWNLVVTADLEETAWDLIKQDRIVQNDVKGAAGNVGDKNYWFNRLDIKVVDNLDNDTYYTGARADTWGLLPQRDTYRPFYIAYLNRQRRPITETVDLPGDMLGFGVRGYWDMNMGYRPVEGDQLQACAISIPTT